MLRRYIFFEACISLSLGCSLFCLEGSYFGFLLATVKPVILDDFFEISIALLLGLVGAAANGQGQEATFSHCRWRSLAIFRRILRRADFAIFEVKKKNQPHLQKLDSVNATTVF